MSLARDDTKPSVQGPVLKIRVNRRAELEDTLEAGVNLIRARAKSVGDVRGILVTRYSPSDFTLEIHPDVPFGTTLENQAW